MSKRWTIVCMALLLATLLMRSNAFCGTDDSGLQVFTLNGADMMGESADVAQEDTKLAQYSLNMFNSGNGLCSFPKPKGSGYEWIGKPDSIAVDAYGYLVVRSSPPSPTSVSSSEVYLHTNPLYASPTSTRKLLFWDAYDITTADLIAFAGLNKAYVFTGNKLVRTTDFWNTTTEITIPAPGAHGAIWQNRFWYSSGYTIYYTAAQDFEDFTNSATKGGTTNIFGCTGILRLVSTRYGLYIFTNNGIFLQSGPSKGWTIEKISELVPYWFSAITTLNDNVFFISSGEQGKKIWQVSGSAINIFAEIPSAFVYTGTPTLAFTNSGKLLMISGQAYNGSPSIYDLKNKSWQRASEYSVIGECSYFVKKTSATQYAIYNTPVAEQFYSEYDYSASAYLTPLSPWQITTSWFTLDGNASNRKEIDRVEMDYQGGTSAVSLIYTSGNGSASSASSFLYAPTNLRMNTYVWNSPIGKQQSNRFYLQFQSYGTQTMTTNYILKQIRVYYRNIGNYKTNALR